MTYEKYIHSQQLEHVKRDAFAKYGEACMACGSHFALSGHHLRYPYPIETTTADDLMVLCWRCHKVLHRTKRVVPVVHTANQVQIDRLRDSLLVFLKGLLQELKEAHSEAPRILRNYVCRKGKWKLNPKRRGPSRFNSNNGPENAAWARAMSQSTNFSRL